ncbi:Transposon Tf2-8 polyprotein [Labeo rohita]|uniref:Gypsy retrotransposon integrase-like protein 1 n=1 Tax=Labeo rohita TaxID=84645 RepID=A0ABQ8MM99_LABRO|nr:Transposon Tf2-8 polyprotein [Labeo rohita]
MALYDDSIGLESFLQRTTRVSHLPQWLLASQYQNPCKLIPPGSHTPNKIFASLWDYAYIVDNRDIISAPAPSDPHARWLLRQLHLPGMNQLQLPRHRHCKVYTVKTIQGKPLGHGKVHHSSPYITLQVGIFHKEEIQFLVLEESTVSIILGCPWLHLHRPELRWDPCDVTCWSQMCYTQCLSKYPHPQSVPALVASTRVESPEPAFTPEIPAEYTAFQDVFSKQAATHLPPHRPWDCAIDLLLGAQLPKGRVYPLSIPERQAMEEYILEALNQGFIRPSTSPAALSFFFMELCGAQVFMKLDLRSAYNLVRMHAGDEWKTAFVTPTGHYEYRVMPCGLSISPSVFQTFMNEVFREFLHRFVVVYIDDILIYSRNMAEHRQHVQQVLHKLRQHNLYLKLEKCDFHKPSVKFLGYTISAEGVQMDQGKIHAIQDWPQPSSIKELHFLGFSNFYRRFIKDYSSNYTSLLRGKLKHLTWSPAAHEAFQQLKHIFSTAPLLYHPDPELPFTVKVDASTTGVGAVLSQAVGEPPILHPCAFYSRKLSPAEQNYDNIPADALSRQSSSEKHTDPEPVIPPNLIVSPIIWNQDQDIQHATLQEPAPLECPEGKIYVPRSQRQTLLGTAHQSPGSGHPGSKRTLSLLQTRYWWPSMRRDTIRYVQSCSVCAMSNSPRMLPTGKLVPLPIPERPWSHLGIDFATDLPSSEGNTCAGDSRSFF